MQACRRSAALPRGLAHEARLYLRPSGLVAGGAVEAALAAGRGRRLAGGRWAFTACEVFVRERARLSASVVPPEEVAAWAESLDEPASGRVAALLERLSAPRPRVVGLGFERPTIMGVINVTPDSFSDGGDFVDPEVAVAHGRALAASGAAVVDIGGESTRPGSRPTEPAEQLRRVLPVVRALADEGVLVSIDTRHAEVMAAALEAGAAVVNDISALTFDPTAVDVVARSGAPVVLMHMQGVPETMQVNPTYEWAALDVYDALEARIEVCRAAGIARERIIVDPGIGFGKTLAHNLEILQNLGLYHGLGCPVLVGVSRKSFIDRVAGAEDPKERLAGSLAAGLKALAQGVQMLRVHDVADTAQAIAVWEALSGTDGGPD